MTDVLHPTPGGSVYVDPDRFALEQSQIFARSWSAVGLAAEVPYRGDFLTVSIAGESVIVVRGDDHVIRSFYNVCRHRGSTICQTASGSVGGHLRCPYHAWSYDLEGHLASAPQMRSLDGLDRRQHGLIPVATEVWNGLIWCNLDPVPPPLSSMTDDEVGRRLGDPSVIERWAMASLVLGARHRYDVAGNWKLLVENFMECYHCATIHPELTRMLPEFRSGLGTQNLPGGSATFAAHVEGFSLSGERRYPRLPGLDPADERLYRGLTLRPTTLINLLPDHVIVHRILPVAADRTLVTCDWLFAADVVADEAFDPTDTVALFDAVNRQDFEACERCQANMGSRGFAAGGVLVPSEAHLQGFHDWVQIHLDAG